MCGRCQAGRRCVLLKVQSRFLSSAECCWSCLAARNNIKFRLSVVWVCFVCTVAEILDRLQGKMHTRLCCSNGVSVAKRIGNLQVQGARGPSLSLCLLLCPSLCAAANFCTLQIQPYDVTWGVVMVFGTEAATGQEKKAAGFVLSSVLLWLLLLF